MKVQHLSAQHVALLICLHIKSSKNMKNLKNPFNDEEILVFNYKPNTKEMKQKNKVIRDINICTIN